MKKQFTHVPLYDVNGVKYDAKRHCRNPVDQVLPHTGLEFQLPRDHLSGPSFNVTVKTLCYKMLDRH
jgi:hypothetical protein